MLVTVHEGGHYLAALLFGVKVEKFSIGFGPKLFSFHAFNTEFRISLIPLGGYVKMKGENPDEEISDPDAFKEKKWWQRAIIAVSGPFANLVFALLIFIFSFLIGKSFEDNAPIIGKIDSFYSQIQEGDKILQVNGENVISWNQIIQNTKDDEIDELQIERDGKVFSILFEDLEKQDWFADILPAASTVIGEVAVGMPAYKAGLQENDKIIAVDQQKVNDWYEMREAIKNSAQNEVVLTIERENQTFQKEIELQENIIDDSRIIGITQKLPVKFVEKYSLWESLKYGTVTTFSFVGLNYAMLYKLIIRPAEITANLGGPVMIYSLSQQSAQKGLDSVLSFIAAISLILMIMNLLPIPILDGGQIFFCIIEGIRGKPLSQRIQMILQNIGIFIILFLMIFAFWNDIQRILTRNLSIKQQQQIQTK